MKIPNYSLLKVSLDSKDTSIIKAEWVDFVTCEECKHRPIKVDADGDDYGFNLIAPNGGYERCPCLLEDGWYSWMPEDNFYCGYGERKMDCKGCEHWKYIAHEWQCETEKCQKIPQTDIDTTCSE